MIRQAAVRTPLVFSVEYFNNPLGQDFFKITEQDNIIFPMEIDPAPVALFRVTALCVNTLGRVENIVKRFFLDISEYDIKILA